MTELTESLRDALYVASTGLTAVSTYTLYDKKSWTRCISGQAAKDLKALGLIRDVKQWKCIEITDMGRHVLWQKKAA